MKEFMLTFVIVLAFPLLGLCYLISRKTRQNLDELMGKTK